MNLVSCSQSVVQPAALRGMPDQDAASCADRSYSSYSCRLDTSAIVLSSFDMGLLVIFLLAWAVSIALARALVPGLATTALLQLNLLPSPPCHSWFTVQRLILR